jgi:hypothetical protein
MGLVEKLVAVAFVARAKCRMRPWRVKTFRSKLASESNTAVMCDDLADWSTKVDARGLTMDASSVEGAILAVKGAVGSQEYYGVWNQDKAHGWVDNTGYATVEELFTRVEEASEPVVDPGWPAAGPEVSGLTVRQGRVDNLSSVEASLSNYEILSGVREVPFSAFSGPDPATARVRKLMSDIEESGEISPLIVVVDSNGPYILEGSHRYDALQHMDKPTFPALVVLDLGETAVGESAEPVNKILEANMDNCVEVQSYTGWLAMVQGVGEGIEIIGDENGATARLGKDDLGTWNGVKGVFNHMVQVPEIGGEPWSEPDTRPGESGKIDKKSGGYGQPVKESVSRSAVLTAEQVAKLLPILDSFTEHREFGVTGSMLNDAWELTDLLRAA